MKNHYLLMSLCALFALSLSFISCRMDDKADEALPRLGISQPRYELALPGTLKDGTNAIVRITANKGYQITSSESWLSVDKPKGKGLVDVTIVCDSNKTGAQREGMLTVKTEGLEETIYVTQTLFDPSVVARLRTFYTEDFSWTLPIAAANNLKDPVENGAEGYTRMGVLDPNAVEKWQTTGLKDWYTTVVNPTGACKINIQRGYLNFNSNSYFNTGIILPVITGTRNSSEAVNATLSFIASPDGGGPDDVPLVVEIISGPGSVKSDSQQAKSNPKLIGSSIGWNTMSYELYGITADTHIAIHSEAPSTQKYCRWYIDNILIKENQ
jgi:lipoprotein